jgi:hypothetical protein
MDASFALPQTLVDSGTLDIQMAADGSPDFYTLGGFWLGALGTVISSVGFGVTIRQLIRTKKAAEAASAAVLQIKMQLYTFGAGVELSKAIETAKQAQRHLRHKAWDSAVDAYANLNESITILLSSVPTIKANHRKSLGIYREELRSTCNSIDVPEFAGGDEIVQRMRGRLRNLTDVLTEVRVSLEKEL